MAHRAHLLAFQRMLARDAKLRLTPRECQILGEAVAAPGPISQRDIGAAIDLSTSQISRVVDCLVARGLLLRTHDIGTDRRLAYVMATEAGRAVDRRVAHLYAKATEDAA